MDCAVHLMDRRTTMNLASGKLAARARTRIELNTFLKTKGRPRRQIIRPTTLRKDPSGGSSAYSSPRGNHRYQKAPASLGASSPCTRPKVDSNSTALYVRRLGMMASTNPAPP